MASRDQWEPSGKTTAECAERALARARRNDRPRLFGRDADGRYLYAISTGQIIRGEREQFRARLDRRASG